jgi:Prealbumin-like fold domain
MRARRPLPLRPSPPSPGPAAVPVRTTGPPRSAPPSSAGGPTWRDPGWSGAGTRARAGTPWWARALAGLGAVLLVAGVALVAAPSPAAAEVVHGLGWSGTVAGWSSWYGSYGMGDLGTAWCIDHGSAAPDAAFGYVPVDLSEVPADTQAAMAWALGATGADPDRVGAAALMLVLHDLMGAVYPAGPLDVDTLDPAVLSGFDGAEAEVVARARAVKADALAHAAVRGPLAMTAEAPGVEPGSPGMLTVAVSDAGGRGVAGVPVHVTATGASLTASPDGVTDAGGRATFPFTAGGAESRFSATGIAPDPTLHAYASSSTPAQRVATPHVVTLEASAGFAPPPSTITVHKTGDADAYLPVGGARFEVRAAGVAEPVGSLVTADDGTTEALPVAPGAYEVAEVEPPPGYRPAGPWQVEVAAGDHAVVEVADEAVPGFARITKVDAATGQPVPGATLALAYDADHDGSYETDLQAVVTDDGPADVRLVPGDYRLTEVRTPDGYEPLDHPVDFSVAPGDRVEVVVENQPAATLAFRKVPVGPVAPDQAVLAGAVFEVRPEGGGEAVGRCTTDDEGRCSLPPASVEAGARYCWEEVEAPPGFGIAEPGCVEAGTAGTVTTVEVREPSRHTDVTGEKVDADTGDAVAGAVYDLYRRRGTADLDRLPSPAPPEDAPGVDEAMWVGRATSDEAGTLAWGPQVPGAVYCAREREAPDGYQLDTALRCTDGPLVAGEPAVIRLLDRPVTPPTTTPPTTTPPTTTPPTTSPPTTTPTTPPTTTPPTTTPPTTSPPTTSPPTTPPTTPPSTFTPRPPTRPGPPPPVPTLPPATVPPDSPPHASLPATGPGTRTAGMASVGSGLLFLGLAAVAARPGGSRRPTPPGLRPPGGAGATRPARPAPPPGATRRSPATPAASPADRWRRRS